MLYDPKTEPFKAAMQFDALGFGYQANELYQQVIAAGGADALEARIYQRRLIRRVEIEAEKEPPEWSFLSVDRTPDIGYLRHVLSKVDCDFHFGTDLSRLRKNVIVRANFSDASDAVVETLFHTCTRLVIIGGDEWYRDQDWKPYRYADLVIKTCHSIFKEQYRSFVQIPVGWLMPEYMDWPKEAPKKTTFDRGYLWSFVGESKKSTRPAMLENMRKVGPGFEHLACGYHDDNKLSTHDYRAILEETIFAPCPPGWANLECFRAWEALEAGCIPIVETRPGLDFYARLAGPNPMLTVRDWSEVPALLAGLGDANAIEALRLSCYSWWLWYKEQLAERVATAIRAL